MLVYEEGSERLVAYTDVPGLPPSDKYAIRVRSAATDNQWIPVFVHKTYNRQQELGNESVPKTDGSILATGVKNYLFFTGAWSHSYANIEMTPNTPVEVEVTSVNGFKIRGQDFYKAAVYPPHKASPARVTGNQVYFTINNPAQIVIDINGNMDDSNKALVDINDRTDIRHTVSLFANPVMAKPSLNDTANVITVEPGGPRPSDQLGSKSTLYFKPGVHQLGLNFKVFPGKNYYIPGDALVYGTFNNNDVPDSGGLQSGQNIKIHGYGTISGQYTDHPDYVVDSVQDHYKGVIIRDAYNTEINGICIADPANHSCNIAAWGGRPDKSVPATFARWVKVISWRGNGDGLGNHHLTEDCFLRTNDDAGYIKGTKRRCTYWKDTSAAVFHMAGIPDPNSFFPIVIEDCDVVYNRARTADGQVGGVFHNRAEGIVGQHTVDVTVRNFRIHDRLANRPVFNMYSQRGIDQGSSYSGITFQNISIASGLGNCTLTGSVEAPWFGGITFDNVTFNDVLLTQNNFGTYFNTDSYVSGVVFTQSTTHDVTLSQPQNGYVASSDSLVDIADGTTVTLTAIPREGFRFAGWSGALSGTTNPIELTASADVTVSALFLQDESFRYVFDTPGTNSLITPPGVFSASIEVWGAGGAGGSAHSGTATQNTQARGGGGAGGSYARVTLPLTPGLPVGYTVGMGGVAAGPGFTHQTYGEAGGVSSVIVGAELRAHAVGGNGGQNVSIVNAIVGGLGGEAPSDGNTGEGRRYGGSGGPGGPGGTGGGGGSAGSTGDGGSGGVFTAGAAGAGGGAEGAVGVNLTAGGNPGGAPGAGGSGAAVRNNTPFTKNNSHETGGRGGDGRVIITFFESPIYFPLLTTAVNGKVIPADGSYAAGSAVSISAVPDPGYRFTGWTGDLSGTFTPEALMMNGPRSVTANFIRTFTFTASTGPGGSISPASGSVHDENGVIDVEAVAAHGYRFAGWGGALSGYQATTALAMNADTFVSANFELIIPTISSRLTSDSIILSWPILSPSWMLQWSPNLEQDSWRNLSGPYQTSSDYYTREEPRGQSKRFFRLIHP